MPTPMRSFDPRRVGQRECRAWVTYYRREWLRLLVNSVGLVRATFGMTWPRTLQGAWLVARANQHWAPAPPDNDPEAARRCMERFYRLVSADSGEPLDAAEASRREIDWWRIHREGPHGQDPGHDGPNPELVEALARLYAFVYKVEATDVTLAARLRAEAMDVSDRWVAAGRDGTSPLVAEEQALLVRSYAALLAAVHR